MTTTDVFQGVGAKNSSRVLAAPGGKSSICFGNPDDSPPAPARRSTDNGAAQDSPAGQGTPAPNAHSHSSIFGEGTDAETPDSLKVKKVSKGSGAYNPITGELYEDSPLNADDSGKKPGEKGRGDFNPITGEAYVPKKEVHTSTRVRQPPGGASSKLW